MNLFSLSGTRHRHRASPNTSACCTILSDSLLDITSRGEYRDFYGRSTFDRLPAVAGWCNR